MEECLSQFSVSYISREIKFYPQLKVHGPQTLGAIVPFCCNCCFHGLPYSCLLLDKKYPISLSLLSSTCPGSACLVSRGSIDLISHLARAAIHPPSCNEVVLRHQLRFGRWKKMQQLAKAPQQMFGRRTSATPWENKLSHLHLHSIA